jgi:beta-carotene/zeaxanthin 4-ketolase
VSPRQTLQSLLLASIILFAWASLTLWSVIWHRWSQADLVLAPLLVAALSGANVGLFIVAHDAMHDALVPASPKLNHALGHLFLGLYVGFSFDRMLAAHRAHHRAPGTPDDPDFDPAHPTRFWPWYGTFLRRHVGWRPFIVGTVVFCIMLVLHGNIANLLAFWAAPAWLASLQLFLFGTFLPHRHGAPFADAHRARGNTMGFVASLLTCYHFGAHHHRHHLAPHLPWWRLPEWGQAK